jgi:hypothetical protein
MFEWNQVVQYQVVDIYLQNNTGLPKPYSLLVLVLIILFAKHTFTCIKIQMILATPYSASFLSVTGIVTSILTTRRVVRS